MKAYELPAKNIEDIRTILENQESLLNYLRKGGDPPLLRQCVSACPYRYRLKEILLEVIHVLEESKKAFKSKQLEALRKKLIKVLAETAQSWKLKHRSYGPALGAGKRGRDGIGMRSRIRHALFVCSQVRKRRKEMNKIGLLVMSGLLILLSAASAFGQEPGVTRKEVDALKAKVERLEKTIENQNSPASKPAGEEHWFERIDMGITAGGVIQGSTGSDDDGVDATGRYELELIYTVTPNDIFYLHLEGGNGEGLDNRVPTLSSLNGDAFGDDDHISVSEAWYLHRFHWLTTVLQVGKVGLGGPGDYSPEDAILFDGNEYANNERSQFLSGGFVNNLALELPDNGLGAMIRVSPGEFSDISAGVADGDGEWNDVFDDVFSIMEINFKPEIAGHPGNYRIYGWFNGSDHEDLKDSTKTREDNYGFGLSFDQEITESLGIFARYGWQRSSVSQIEHAWSTGFQCSRKFYGREDDTFGLAYGMAIIGNDWKDANSGINSGDEHHVELYYNMKVNDHLNISPDIQWVKNPNGDRDNDDIWVFGIRAQLSF